MLAEEVARRAQRVWPAAGAGGGVITLRDAGTAVRGGARWSDQEARSFRAAEFAARPEGFSVARSGDSLTVTGNDARGVLYGVGLAVAPPGGAPQRGAAARCAAGQGAGPHGAALPAARPSDRLPAEDQLLRRLDRGRVGTVHPRAGDVRRQRGGSDPAGVRRRGRLRPLPAAADRHAARGVRHRRPLRHRPVDLVSRPGVRLRRRCHRAARARRLARGVRGDAADRRRVHPRRRSGIDTGAPAAGPGGTAQGIPARGAPARADVDRPTGVSRRRRSALLRRPRRRARLAGRG